MQSSCHRSSQSSGKVRPIGHYHEARQVSGRSSAWSYRRDMRDCDIRLVFSNVSILCSPQCFLCFLNSFPNQEDLDTIELLFLQRYNDITYTKCTQPSWIDLVEGTVMVLGIQKIVSVIINIRALNNVTVMMSLTE